MEDKTVGIFTVKQLSKGRWEVHNTITKATHVTYGTEAEVDEQLVIQTKAWKEKVARVFKHKGKAGSAWRDRANAAMKAARERDIPEEAVSNEE
jgi:hypothetical protein